MNFSGLDFSVTCLVVFCILKSFNALKIQFSTFSFSSKTKKYLESLLEASVMLPFILAGNQNICAGIDKYQIPRYLVNELMKCLCSISYTERHPGIFLQPTRCYNCDSWMSSLAIMFCFIYGKIMDMWCGLSIGYCDCVAL